MWQDMEELLQEDWTQKMSVSEMEQIGFDEGVEYVRNMIRKAIDNPNLDLIPPKMVLQLLLASLEPEPDYEND